MFDYFDKLTEQAANKSFDDIYSFYNEEFYPMEYFLRSMIRQYISRNLIDKTEDNPLDCDIVVENQETFGLSSLEMPRIVKMWQDEQGIIWCQEQGIDEPAELDFYSPYELMSIIEGFKEYEM